METKMYYLIKAYYSQRCTDEALAVYEIHDKEGLENVGDYTVIQKSEDMSELEEALRFQEEYEHYCLFR